MSDPAPSHSRKHPHSRLIHHSSSLSNTQTSLVEKLTSGTCVRRGDAKKVRRKGVGVQKDGMRKQGFERKGVTLKTKDMPQTGTIVHSSEKQRETPSRFPDIPTLPSLVRYTSCIIACM